MFQDPKHLSRFQLIDEGERLQEVTRLPFMEGRDVFVDLTLHFLCVTLCIMCCVYCPEVPILVRVQDSFQPLNVKGGTPPPQTRASPRLTFQLECGAATISSDSAYLATGFHHLCTRHDSFSNKNYHLCHIIFMILKLNGTTWMQARQCPFNSISDPFPRKMPS